MFKTKKTDPLISTALFWVYLRKFGVVALEYSSVHQKVFPLIF